MDYFVHPTAAIADSAIIGGGTSIWQHCVILDEVIIGKGCNICFSCFIESGVRVGNHVTIKNGVYLWIGVIVEDDVFIGPNVTFCNDRFPRSHQYPDKYLTTTLKAGCSIGSGAVILPGVEVGEKAMVGAGAVVTKNVSPKSLVVGNPARFVRYVD